MSFKYRIVVFAGRQMREVQWENLLHNSTGNWKFVFLPIGVKYPLELVCVGKECLKVGCLCHYFVTLLFCVGVGNVNLVAMLSLVNVVLLCSQETCKDVPDQACTTIISSVQERKCFNVTELKCRLQEDVQYETVQAVFTVQKCQTVPGMLDNYSFKLWLKGLGFACSTCWAH